MPLNIYKISHPLIERLSNKIIHESTAFNKATNIDYKELGKLLIYEATRKKLKIHKIYIKNLNKTKELCILDPKITYIIITDLIHYHSIVTEIETILPKIKLSHYDFHKHKLQLNQNTISETITTNHKIIIITKILDNYYIIDLLNHLLLEKHVKLDQVQIICIACKNKVLNKIGKKYPYLNVYTAKILNN